MDIRWNEFKQIIPTIGKIDKSVLKTSQLWWLIKREEATAFKKKTTKVVFVSLEDSISIAQYFPQATQWKQWKIKLQVRAKY